MKAFAITDGNTIIEQSATGHLNIYYALDDAIAAFPIVKRGCSQSMQKELRISSVQISKPKMFPLREPGGGG